MERCIVVINVAGTSNTFPEWIHLVSLLGHHQHLSYTRSCDHWHVGIGDFNMDVKLGLCNHKPERKLHFREQTEGAESKRIHTNNMQYQAVIKKLWISCSASQNPLFSKSGGPSADLFAQRSLMQLIRPWLHSLIFHWTKTNLLEIQLDKNNQDHQFGIKKGAVFHKVFPLHWGYYSFHATADTLACTILS